MWSRFFEGPVAWAPFILALLPTLALAWACGRLARQLASNGLHALLGETPAVSSPLVKAPLRVMAIGAFLLVSVLLLFPAFELAGLRPRIGIHTTAVKGWAFGPGLHIVVIALLAYALIHATALVVRRFEHEIGAGSDLDALERAKRARTLGTVISKATTFIIVLIAALTILDELGIVIMPVLTGAGIAGVAVGFGAQTLVKDVIGGFFLLLENQVRVGDVASINGTGGLVEELNLRTIVLRDAEGTVHVFPNGSITTLSNKSKEFSYYVIDLAVSYREDPDRVAGILRDIGAGMEADTSFSPFILAPIEVLGLDAFTDWSMIIKLRIKTMPLKQWEVGRELRKRIKRAFDEHGIGMASPERVVRIRETASDPDAERQ